MPTGHIPILQIKTKDGKWLPVNAIGGQVASKVLYNNTYVTVEQALDYLFENGTGGSTGGGTGGSTGSGLFIVKVQAQSGADEYTITSHDKTYAQIDAAYKAGKQILALFTIDEDATYLLPLVFASQSDYAFGVFVGSVFTINVDNADSWYCSVGALDADSINVRSSADAGSSLTSLQNVLDYIVYPAVDKSHTHTNKAVIDAFSDSEGSLRYNNKPLTVQKISEGSNIILSDNTEYRLTNVSTLKLFYPVGDFECWMRLNFAASGNITVTLPADTKYIGTAPDFKNGETWELSFKDKILAAQKVGEGT